MLTENPEPGKISLILFHFLQKTLALWRNKIALYLNSAEVVSADSKYHVRCFNPFPLKAPRRFS